MGVCSPQPRRRSSPSRLLKGPICGVGALARRCGVRVSTPRTSHRAPPLHLDPFEQPGRKWILQQPASLIPGSENIVTNKPKRAARLTKPARFRGLIGRLNSTARACSGRTRRISSWPAQAQAVSRGFGSGRASEERACPVASSKITGDRLFPRQPTAAAPPGRGARSA